MENFQLELFYKRLTNTAVKPVREHDTDAGYDLFADEDIILTCKPYAVSTGIAVAIPKGYYGRVAERSGNALNKGIHVGAGVVDSGYRGEIKVVCSLLAKPELTDEIKIKEQTLEIKKGFKIAQLIITKIETPELVEVDILPVADRGEKGFGSSDKKL